MGSAPLIATVKGGESPINHLYFDTSVMFST